MILRILRALASTLMICCVFPRPGLAIESLTIVVPSADLVPEHPFAPSRHPNIRQNLVPDLLHASMMTLNNKNRWNCRLCKKFPGVENGQISRFKNKEGKNQISVDLEFSDRFRWGDGRAVTAYDLRFAWLVSKQLDSDHRGRFFFDRIESIKISKNHARFFTLTLKDDSYLFSDWGEIVILPHHLEESIWLNARKDSSTYLKNSLYNKQPLNPGLYSGPYLLTAIAKSKVNETTQLRSNDHYGISARPSPLIELSSIGNQRLSKPPINQAKKSTRALIIPTGQNWSRAEVRLLEGALSEQGLKLTYRDTCTLEILAFNLRSPSLRDLRVRQALVHTIDKDEIIRSIYPSSIPANNFVHPSDPMFSAFGKFYEVNIAKSHRLIAEAKWLISKKDKLRRKFNKTLSLNIVTNKDPKRIKLASYLASEWKKIGVESEVISEGNKKFQKTINRKDFSDVSILSLELPLSIPLDALFSKAAIPTIRNDYNGQNIFAWNNKKTEDNLLGLAKEWSDSKRLEASHSIQHEFLEKLPAATLLYHLEEINSLNLFLPAKMPGNQFPLTHYIHQWKGSSPTEEAPLIGAKQKAKSKA